MDPNAAGAWHIVVAPRPLPPDVGGPGAVLVPPVSGKRARSWQPSRAFVLVVLLVLGAFATIRLLGVHRVGAPDRTAPGPVVTGPFGGTYALDSVHPDGEPVRWNPCVPIRYVVNLAYAPPSAAAELAGALERMTEATGLAFEFEGTTDEVPHDRRSAYQPDRYGKRWAPLLVAWYPLGRTDLPHRPETVGVGAPVSVTSGRRTQIVSGQVVLNASRQLSPGFDTKTSWGGIVLHELGHAVGLGHVGDPAEIMFEGSTARLGRADWGPGDLEGLRRLGRGAGCLSSPEPGPVVFAEG